MEDYLLLKTELPDLSKIKNAVSEGYGIGAPEHIQGFMGSFAFYVPDIYVSQAVYTLLQRDASFKDILLQCLDRFRREDYGDIPDEDLENNNEQRYLCGSSNGMVAAYSTIYGILHFAVQGDKSLFSL